MAEGKRGVAEVGVTRNERRENLGDRGLEAALSLVHGSG